MRSILLNIIMESTMAARLMRANGYSAHDFSIENILGLPFDIASYAFLTQMVAQQCDLGVNEFIWTGGNCHLYSNLTKQAELQLTRVPYPLAKLSIRHQPKTIFDYCCEDLDVINYKAHARIVAAVAV